MRHAIHKLIVWYLRRCDGAFHCYPYGERGRYVMLMTETQYGQAAKMLHTGIEPRCEQAIREILIAHGSYGDGGNLDKRVRQLCLDALHPLVKGQRHE